MIDYIHKDLYWQDSIDKQLKIELEDGTILDNSMIYSEEFELEESLCSDDELRFGACEASCVKFRIFAIFNRLVGQKITISEVVGGQTDSPMQMGKYKIASAKPTADRDFIDIVAYDSMYDIIHADVAAWYNNQFKATTTTTTDEDGNETTVVTYSTTTLKKFRDSFFSHFGIEQVNVTLPNDGMVVSKTIEIVPNEDGTIGETLSGSTVIEAICELNGCFGHINRDGKFEYVTLQAIAKELFPADDLFPRNDLYPASDNVGLVIYNWQYEATEYEDFDVQPITQVQIIQEDNDIGMTVGNDGNKYVVNSNFLTYSLSDAELETVGTNMLSVVEKAKYTPIKASVIGNPCVTVGDIIKIVTNSAILYSYVINRTLKGCQSLTDEFESNGEEYRSVDVNSTSSQIKKLQGRSNVLERSIDETRSAITNVEKGLKSEIKQTANEITSIVSSTQSKWHIPDEYKDKNIKYGYNEIPTGDYYVDLTTGIMYITDRSGPGPALIQTQLKKVEDVLESQISETATNITASVTEKLKNYSTIEEMNSAISISKDSIESTVSKTQSKWKLPNNVEESNVIYGYGTAESNGLDPEENYGKAYLDVETGLLQTNDRNLDHTRYWWNSGIQCDKIENILQSSINMNANDISIEVERATEAEGELSSKIELNAENISLEVNRATTKEEDLQSSIDMHANEIVLKVDANGRIVEVSLTGDPKDGTEFTVNADNISLAASDIIDIIANNSINLTSKNISIESTNFSVDEDGNMKCNGGEFSGTVKGGSVIGSTIYGDRDLYLYETLYNPSAVPNYRRALSSGEVSNVVTGKVLFVGDGFEGVYLPQTVFLGYNNVFPVGSQTDSLESRRITEIHLYAPLGKTNFNFTADNGVTYAIAASASDTKLKENIEETEQTSLDKIRRIQFIQFDWKEDKSHVPLGVSANQLGEIIPQAVLDVPQPDDSEYDTIKNVDMFTMLNYSLKAIQELSEVVDSQREEIDTLKQQLATLTERIDRYEQSI
nr:MAG TPA: tail protein [Bacteriophage sp.]